MSPSGYFLFPLTRQDSSFAAMFSVLSSSSGTISIVFFLGVLGFFLPDLISFFFLGSIFYVSSGKDSASMPLRALTSNSSWSSSSRDNSGIALSLLTEISLLWLAYFFFAKSFAAYVIPLVILFWLWLFLPGFSFLRQPQHLRCLHFFLAVTIELLTRKKR